MPISFPGRIRNMDFLLGGRNVATLASFAPLFAMGLSTLPRRWIPSPLFLMKKSQGVCIPPPPLPLLPIYTHVLHSHMPLSTRVVSFSRPPCTPLTTKLVVKMVLPIVCSCWLTNVTVFVARLRTGKIVVVSVDRSRSVSRILTRTNFPCPTVFLKVG